VQHQPPQTFSQRAGWDDLAEIIFLFHTTSPSDSSGICQILQQLMGLLKKVPGLAKLTRSTEFSRFMSWPSNFFLEDILLSLLWRVVVCECLP
jgi:hypothetical protein